MITQAVISAGGFGARLKPFTDTAPKPMIPILGKPLLEWHVDAFKKHGVTEFFISLHHMPEVVMEYFGDGSKFGVSVQYFIEKEPLGSVGALKKFEPYLSDTFYFIYGDVFSLMNYSKMADAYARKESPIGMQRIRKTDECEDADVAELCVEGRVTAIHPKPHTATYPNACRMRGSFILDRRILSYVPEDTAFDMGKELLPAVVNAGENFYAYECDEYSKGVDTMEKLNEVLVHLGTLT
ncbi:MAG TPA: nucleotidyltransferase family protein [Candidatus Paceibacterota bacterium]